MKQQLYAVKSTLVAINNTLTIVEYNEWLLREGVRNITHVDSLKSGTRGVYWHIQYKGRNTRSRFGGHQRYANVAMWTSFTASVGSAQRGVLQPQIISPYLLMEALMQSVPSLSRDVMLPFPLSKDLDYEYLVLWVCNLQVYVSNGI
jgi:hypothetical protein